MAARDGEWENALLRWLFDELESQSCHSLCMWGEVVRQRDVWRHEKGYVIFIVVPRCSKVVGLGMSK
jgi:hypothetical protein